MYDKNNNTRRKNVPGASLHGALVTRELFQISHSMMNLIFILCRHKFVSGTTV
jgi:hypothetical protein